MLKQIDKIFLKIVVIVVFITVTPAFAVLSCSVTTAAGCTDTIVLRMSSSTNAHAELPWQSTSGYSNNVICCNGINSISCTAGFAATVLKLSSSTNAHVEINTNTNYSTSSCISSVSGLATIGYQDNNCSGFDTTLASISGDTNASMGTSTVYTKKVCGTVAPPSLTFMISTSSVFLGQASPAYPRFASSTNQNGSDFEVQAHTFLVLTTASNGYVVTVRGATLTAGTSTISAIGATNTAPATGTSQFGVRMTASGGVGSVTSPYAASGFAYAATATTSSQVASASTGDNATTTFSVRYVANIAPTTPADSYTANIVFVATANF